MSDATKGPVTMLIRVKWIDAVRDDESLSATEKLVMVMLISRANDRGEAWPSLKKLARDTGRTRNTCRDTVKALVARGLLAVEPRPGDDGDRDQPNVYRVTMGSTADPMGSTTAPISPKGPRPQTRQMGSTNDPHGVNSSPPGVNGWTGVGSTTDPEPSHSSPSHLSGSKNTAQGPHASRSVEGEEAAHHQSVAALAAFPERSAPNEDAARLVAERAERDRQGQLRRAREAYWPEAEKKAVGLGGGS